MKYTSDARELARFIMGRWDGVEDNQDCLACKHHGSSIMMAVTPLIIPRGAMAQKKKKR